MSGIDEALVEAAALEWFGELGYGVAHGLIPDVERRDAERRSYADTVLVERLRSAIARLNPGVPAEAREDALKRALRADGPGLVTQNDAFHRLLVDGAPVEYARRDGSIAGDAVWLVDFEHPERNDWLVANQVSFGAKGPDRRADVVVFLNGLPVALVELKNPLEKNATLQGAFNQLQTYMREFPALFQHNELLVIADGREARMGTITSDWARFMPWKTIDGQGLAPSALWELEVLIKGVFQHRRLLDLLRHFIVFETDGVHVSKKVAAYHQYHAVNKAVAATIEAASAVGDRKAGVVWHTQGSGKSLTMAFYAGKIVRHPAMENPTIVVLSDRNDLDDQLFGAFAACEEVLRQTPDGQEQAVRDIIEQSEVLSSEWATAG